MADRFWVGGTGTWDTTSTTNWSATTGGVGGASVPTVADSVFFDQAGIYTVTLTGALTCSDWTVSAGTVTFVTGTGPTMSISGSITFATSTTAFSGASFSISLSGSAKTITTNGVILPGNALSIALSGVYSLGSALTVTNNITCTGTLNTNNYALTYVGLFGSGTVNWGSSTVTSSGTAVFGTGSNITLNAGTSQLNCTHSVAVLSPAGVPSLTFYNVAFTSTTVGTKVINNVNTFNNLSVAGPASAGATTLSFTAQQTINGTLSTTGTAGNRRVFFTTATYGISQDLVVNGAPNLTNADFRGLYVRGTASPITGTRIGNRGECRGITFSAPKTVYWNLAAGGNWTEDAWAASIGGTVNTDNFPLPQDTATVTNTGLNSTGTITLNTSNISIGNFDMSGRTNAMTLNVFVSATVYGNWTSGSGVTFSTANTITFSGGTTQIITSAGRTFSFPITVDTYDGTVLLADALNIGTQSLTITNGTFTTQGYSIIGILVSNNSNVRTINLGASVVSANTNAAALFTTATNLTFNCGTSTLNYNSGGQTFNGGDQTYYNVSITGSSVATSILGQNVFNNLTLQSRFSDSISNYVLAANQTVTGTFTCAGSTVVQRTFVQSSSLGTPRTITANILSAQNCDFRDITIAGAATGSSPIRAGDCGGNTGITFPAPKTVYWNLTGSVNWSATAWATTSGGIPAANNFPLAQDTAVFDTASAIGTITIDGAWNIGTFDASLRTGVMSITTATNLPVVYGDWKFGTGVTLSSSTGTITFSKKGTQTITSNGIQFGCPVTTNHPSGTVQLADAISVIQTRTLGINAGTFDAVTYNVTVGAFSFASGTTVRMGSGTWTLSGTGTVWTAAGTSIAGTSTIVLSDISTGARTFSGGGLYYNKLTIGGTTGTSTTSIISANTFGELASTKTVAHTIDFGNNSQTFGKWSVTGTLGNVVSIAGTSTTNVIAGPAVTGVDYLAMNTWGISTASPGEFYAGANSTGGATAPLFRTAAPAPRTLYWVGGTGNWSSTTKWDTASGGAGGKAIPTSLDAVIFDSASSATAYTATIDAGVTLARCAAFTMAGPASGNVTFAGTVPVAFHGSVSFAATGITRSYTGNMNLVGNSSYTFTTNGLVFNSTIFVAGIGATWTLGSSLNITSAQLTITYGVFDTSSVSSYAMTMGLLFSSNSNARTLKLNNSLVTLSSGQPAISFGNITNFIFNAGSSTISMSSQSPGITSGGLTFNNVSFTSAAGTSIPITGANTFNTLSFAGRTSLGITPVIFNANQTIGTLTLGAGTAAAYRTFLASNTIGTQRTLDVTTLTAGAADIDFRDITIASAISSITFNTSGSASWIVPAGVTSVTAKLWGAGGGSGGNGYIEGGGGGGGGAFASKVLSVTPGQSISYTVGAGGSAGGYNGFGQTEGITGGSTTFSSVTAGGGGGGGDGTGGTGGTASGGDVNTAGLRGYGSFEGANSYKGGLAGNSPNATASSAVSPYNGLQPGGGQGGGGGDFIGKGGDGRITLEWSGLSLPITGTRFGDAKGNSGITFPAAKTVYWTLAAGGNWSATAWATTPGGAADINNFPLAQDTAVFPLSTPTAGNTVTINQTWNLGTIDMSARFSNAMTLAWGGLSTFIYGNFINGFSTTITGTLGSSLTFSGRTAQTITSAGKSLPMQIAIDTPGGTVTLQDALDLPQSSAIVLSISKGTFDAANYNVTLSDSVAGVNSGTATTRTIALGSGTWTIAGSNPWSISGAAYITVTGTGTINLTSASAKTFGTAGNGVNYSGITLNQGGAGTLTLAGNNTFKTITNTYSATGATTINLANTTTTLTQPWQAKGEQTRVLTVSGTSAASPATLIFSGTGQTTNLDYLNLSNIKAYPITNKWSTGLNSTNGGTLGWLFGVVAAAVTTALNSFFMLF